MNTEIGEGRGREEGDEVEKKKVEKKRRIKKKRSCMEDDGY